MPAELAAVLTFLAVVGFGIALLLRVSALSRPLAEHIVMYKDALLALSLRADKAEKIALAAGDILASFERAVGDKKAIEHAAQFEREQNAYLRERVTELQRALLALHNPTVEARVVGQTNRGKEPAEAPYIPGPTRVQAASGNYSPPYWGGKPPLQDELVRTSTSFKGPSDYRGLAERESGLHLSMNDEAF